MNGLVSSMLRSQCKYWHQKWNDCYPNVIMNVKSNSLQIIVEISPQATVILYWPFARIICRTMNIFVECSSKREICSIVEVLRCVENVIETVFSMFQISRNFIVNTPEWMLYILVESSNLVSFCNCVFQHFCDSVVCKKWMFRLVSSLW